MSQPLFSSYDLAGLTLPNRLVMAPMTRSRALPGNVANPLSVDYYVQRAAAGLLVTEGTQVSPQGQGYIATPGIYSPEQEAAWRVVVDAVHAAGGRIYAQLWHVGRVSHTAFQPDGGAPVAPSATGPISGQTYTPQGPAPFSAPRALELSEIAGVVEQFAHGARVAKAAGFDGVEIHGANGYLVDQFLRDGSNRRTDAYGGSIPNRVRFLLEVVDAVSAVYGAGRVGVRVSPGGAFNDMSDSDPAALFSTVARELSARKLGYLHAVDPVGEDGIGKFGALLRSNFVGTLILNGGYSRDAANAAIEARRADLVSFGVPFLANPDLVRRFEVGAPLNAPDFGTFYGGGEKGYTDYPTFAG